MDERDYSAKELIEQNIDESEGDVEFVPVSQEKIPTISANEDDAPLLGNYQTEDAAYESEQRRLKEEDIVY